MPEIHHTAIVGPKVELADDVRVGPGCVIEGLVRIGEGGRLLHYASIRGPVTIGRRVAIYPNASIGDGRGTAGAVVGDDAVIREGVVIELGLDDRPTVLGDRDYVMVNAHIGPGARIGDDCTLVNGSAVDAGCELGDGVILGGKAVVGPRCRVGRLTMVSGARDIALDVPPFCVMYNARRVSSLNVVGLRRSGARQHVGPLHRAFKLLYREGLEPAEAVERVEAECGGDLLCAELAEFVRASARGITPYAASDFGD